MGILLLPNTQGSKLTDPPVNGGAKISPQWPGLVHSRTPDARQEPIRVEAAPPFRTAWRLI